MSHRRTGGERREKREERATRHKGWMCFACVFALTTISLFVRFCVCVLGCQMLLLAGIFIKKNKKKIRCDGRSSARWVQPQMRLTVCLCTVESTPLSIPSFFLPRGVLLFFLSILSYTLHNTHLCSCSCLQRAGEQMSLLTCV